MNRHSDLALRLLLVVGSVGFVLTVGEVFARLTYRPPLDMRGEFEAREPYRDQLDAMGFREDRLKGRDLAVETTRVLFLGDSFTFGSGVADPEQRFTNRLEERLNQGSAGARFHFFNAGIPGSRPSQWVRAARVLLPNYRPRAVIAVFFLRDGTEIGTSLHLHEGRIAEIKARHGSSALYRLSYLARRVYDRRVLREFSEWYLGQFRSAYLGEPGERRVWLREQQALVALRDLAERSGASFHLVIFPLLFGLDDYAFHDVEAEIESFAAGQGMSVMSLTPGFLGRSAPELWVSPVDQHPNAEGHAIAADTLEPFLREALAPSG